MRAATAQRVPPTRSSGLAALGLAALAFAAFVPALRCGFVNFDDPSYVSKTPQVLGGLSREGVRWAFTTFRVANWHPLTWLSLQLDASLWGAEPRGFHLTNVLLHAANAALLFLALRALTGGFWRSAAVALLFAMHPLRVESVAWVSERKDVLCAFFGLLAPGAYARYVQAPALGRYLAVLALFALSLMAKPMLVTLPCLLLVLDWWPLARARARSDWRKLAAEKLPLFALAAASAAITYHAQVYERAVGDLGRFPLSVRAGNAAVSYVAYLSKTVWPVNLAVFYPHPGAAVPAWQVAAAALLLAALTAVAVALRRRAPYVLAGWLWYLGMLVPVIGLVQAGSQAYADRYTYLPQVGLLVALCWGIADLARGRTRAALAAAVVAAAALAGVTWIQLGVWRNSVTLWEQDLEVAGPSAPALLGLGEGLEAQGRDEEAIPRYRQALECDPDSVVAHSNLGGLLCGRGELDEAEHLLRKAIALQETFAPAHANLGNVLFRRGDLEEAARENKLALHRDPGSSDACRNLGLIEFTRGNLDRAAEWYREALRLRPDSPEALGGLGNVLTRQGRSEEGIALLREAVRRNPRFGDGQVNLGKALAERGDLEGAARHFAEATRINPAQAAAWYNLGAARLRQGRLAEAIDFLARAANLEPSSDAYRNALEKALEALSRAGRDDLVQKIRGRLPRPEHGRPAAPAADRAPPAGTR